MKRYEVNLCNSETFQGMIEAPDGDWVAYDELGVVSMDKDKFYKIAKSMEPEKNCRLSGDGKPLSKDKQRWLNIMVGEIRALRELYGQENPLIKEICTNLLVEAILLDGE